MGRLALREVVIDVVDMVLIHYLVQEVVDIQLRTTIHDGLHLVQEFLELQTLCRCNIIKRYLAVDGLNDLHLQQRLLSHRTHTQVRVTHNLVLITVGLDEVDELLGIRLFDLSLTDALYIIQFLEGDRIVGCHLFDADILEDDIWRTFQAP